MGLTWPVCVTFSWVHLGTEMERLLVAVSFQPAVLRRLKPLRETRPANLSVVAIEAQF